MSTYRVEETRYTKGSDVRTIEWADQETFESRSQAVDRALSLWSHLTDAEKERTMIEVIEVDMLDCEWLDAMSYDEFVSEIRLFGVEPIFIDTMGWELNGFRAQISYGGEKFEFTFSETLDRYMFEEKSEYDEAIGDLADRIIYDKKVLNEWYEDYLYESYRYAKQEEELHERKHNMA